MWGELEVAPSQAYFLQKRRGVGPLFHPMPSWICIDTVILCPGVIDREEANTVGNHSSQTITFRMMVVSSHFFDGIEERAHVFIPLNFRHKKEARSMWRAAFFSYLDGVWEWVQVTSNHADNYYTHLAHSYAVEKALNLTLTHVSSIAPPTECSLVVTMPFA